MTTAAIEKIESLMVWIHDRPAMYAGLVGELDTAFWYLHMVWAKLVDREREYSAIRNEINGYTALGILNDEERKSATDKDHPTTQKVLAFWSAIDARLGVRIRCESWMDPPEPNTDPLSPEQ